MVVQRGPWWHSGSFPNLVQMIGGVCICVAISISMILFFPSNAIYPIPYPRLPPPPLPSPHKLNVNGGLSLQRPPLRACACGEAVGAAPRRLRGVGSGVQAPPGPPERAGPAAVSTCGPRCAGSLQAPSGQRPRGAHHEPGVFCTLTSRCSNTRRLPPPLVKAKAMVCTQAVRL